MRFAETTVALPWDASAQLAEAHVCRAALELLEGARGGRLMARVVGDNLAVIRYGRLPRGYGRHGSRPCSNRPSGACTRGGGVWIGRLCAGG